MTRRFEDRFGGGFGRGFDDWLSRMREASFEGEEADMAALFSPVEPYNRWPFLVPVVSFVGAAAVVALAGVAVASLLVMAAALAAVWFLLSEVFGYEVSVPVRSY